MQIKGFMLVAAAMLAIGIGVGRISAGNPDAPGGPTAPTAQMYTLDQIYQRLISGTVSSPMTAFTEPSTAPGSPTMHSLNDIMAVAPSPDITNGVTSRFVLTGTTFWGLNLMSGVWGPQTGAAAVGQDVVGPNGALTFPIPDGMYFTRTAPHVVFPPKMAIASDTNLTPENIRAKTSIFGVTGSMPAAGVQKTGQTACYDATATGSVISCTNTGEDGELQKGATPPNPRFTVEGPGALEGPGTVTDNYTGLIWLRNANCYGQVTWGLALNLVIQVNNNNACGAPFNQSPGAQWRLPNVRELQTLIDYGHSNPALPANYTSVFTNFPTTADIRYWSSTTEDLEHGHAWEIDFNVGTVNRNQTKTTTYYVWPVRGGQ